MQISTAAILHLFTLHLYITREMELFYQHIDIDWNNVLRGILSRQRKRCIDSPRGYAIIFTIYASHAYEQISVTGNKKLRGRLVSKRKGNNSGCYADVRLETGMCDRNRDSIHFGSPRGDTISTEHVYHI